MPEMLRNPSAPPIPIDDALHEAVVENLYDGVYYVDRARRIRYWNRGAERISGHTADAVVGRRCYDNILNHVDGDGRVLCRSMCPLAETMATGESHEVEVYLRHADGHRLPVRVRTAPIRDRAGAIIGAVEVFDDASLLADVRHEAEQLRDAALHDPLTGLPNRRHLDFQLAARFAERYRGGRSFGLLMIDLDHFKQLNDRVGHAGGDVALQVVAATLEAASRIGDGVARWGGEEFVAVVAGVDAAGLGRAADRFVALIRRSRVVVDGAAVAVTASVGGTVARVDDTPESLIARADAALYAAKAAGRDRVLLADDPDVPTG